MLAETQLVMCGERPVQRQRGEAEIFHVSSLSQALWFSSCCLRNGTASGAAEREGPLFLEIGFIILDLYNEIFGDTLSRSCSLLPLLPFPLGGVVNPFPAGAAAATPVANERDWGSSQQPAPAACCCGQPSVD